MTKELNEKMFFIVEQYNAYDGKRFSIHDRKMYDMTSATRIMLALDTLNEDRERYSHYLQEVDKGMLPLVLTDEVVEKEQSEMPF